MSGLDTLFASKGLNMGDTIFSLLEIGQKFRFKGTDQLYVKTDGSGWYQRLEGGQRFKTGVNAAVFALSDEPEKKSEPATLPPELIIEGRPVKDVLQELSERIAPELAEIGEQRISCALWPTPDNRAFPTEWKWLSCFVVKGGSEGFYVHIEIIHRDDTRELIGLLKCWSWNDAFRIANAATLVLYGYR